LLRDRAALPPAKRSPRALMTGQKLWARCGLRAGPGRAPERLRRGWMRPFTRRGPSPEFPEIMSLLKTAPWAEAGEKVRQACGGPAEWSRGLGHLARWLAALLVSAPGCRDV